MGGGGGAGLGVDAEVWVRLDLRGHIRFDEFFACTTAVVHNRNNNALSPRRDVIAEFPTFVVLFLERSTLLQGTTKLYVAFFSGCGQFVELTRGPAVSPHRLIRCFPGHLEN